MSHLLIEMKDPTVDGVDMFGVAIHSKFPEIWEVHDIGTNQFLSGRTIISMFNDPTLVFISKGISSLEIEYKLEQHFDWGEPAIQIVANTAFNKSPCVVTSSESPDPDIEDGRHIQPIIARIRHEDYEEVKEWFNLKSNTGSEE